LASLLSAFMVEKVNVPSAFSTVTVFIDASVMVPVKLLGVLSLQAARPHRAMAATMIFMRFIVRMVFKGLTFPDIFVDGLCRRAAGTHCQDYRGGSRHGVAARENPLA